jgi:signal transduction histidine kinase
MKIVAMSRTTSEAAFRSFLYGAAAMLLIIDVFFLVRALFTSNFVPIVPTIAGGLTAAGLLFVIYAEHQARERDRKDHRRISRVAHQLESPLHALQRDLGHLTAKAENLPAEVRLKLKHMETKTKVLLENVRDVFLLLQAQEHNIAQNVRTYNLCTLVEDVIEDQRPLASARNVEIITKLHCQDAPVRVDKQLWHIALTHLIENAVLYTLTPGLVNVAVVRRDKRVRVVVQDRGIGINDEEAELIWHPFARGERAMQHDPDGIGAGLALTRLIVKEFGGTIRYISRSKGMGTQFEISLPLAKK